MNLQNKTLKCCPFCRGTTGYFFTTIEKMKYDGMWENYPNAYQGIDAARVIKKTIPICIDCGKRVKYEIEYPE